MTAGYTQIIELLTNLPILQTIHLPAFFKLILAYQWIQASKMPLCSSCHHDIIFGKINFIFSLTPPYSRTIWENKNDHNNDLFNVLKKTLNGNTHLKVRLFMKRCNFLRSLNEYN